MGIYVVDKDCNGTCSKCRKKMRGIGGLVGYGNNGSSFLCANCTTPLIDDLKKVIATSNFECEVGDTIVLESSSGDRREIEVTRMLKTKMHCDLEDDFFTPSNKNDELSFDKPLHTGMFVTPANSLEQYHIVDVIKEK